MAARKLSTVLVAIHFSCPSATNDTDGAFARGFSHVFLSVYHFLNNGQRFFIWFNFLFLVNNSQTNSPPNQTFRMFGDFFPSAFQNLCCHNTSILSHNERRPD